MLKENRVYTPITELKNVIDCFYISTGNFARTDVFQVPVMHQELVVNLGDSFIVSDIDGNRLNPSGDSWLAGLQTGSTVSTLFGNHLMVGILFKPWGLRQLFGIKAEALLDGFFTPDFYPGILTIVTYIRDNQNCLWENSFFSGLESVVKSVSKPAPLNQGVMNAISICNEPFPNILLSTLARESGLSSKSFIGGFRDSVGLTPSRYFNLKRILHARQMIANAPRKKLTDLSIELGYFDQAHFTRSFKSVCLLSPKEIKKME